MTDQDWENRSAGGMKIGTLTGIMIFSDFTSDSLVYSKSTLETEDKIETTEFINKNIEGWEIFVK